jgi:dCMP deaminase
MRWKNIAMMNDPAIQASSVERDALYVGKSGQSQEFKFYEYQETYEPKEDCYASAVTIPMSLMMQVKLWAACRSKDPNTKVGAVVYDPRSGASFFGYNGFNKGVPDLKEHWDRRTTDGKYARARHAEQNAIEKAWKCIRDLEHCILCITHYPCHTCMNQWIIPSGIKTLYYESDYPHDDMTYTLAREAGILLIRLRLPVSRHLSDVQLGFIPDEKDS